MRLPDLSRSQAGVRGEREQDVQVRVLLREPANEQPVQLALRYAHTSPSPVPLTNLIAESIYENLGDNPAATRYICETLVDEDDDDDDEDDADADAQEQVDKGKGVDGDAKVDEDAEVDEDEEVDQLIPDLRAILRDMLDEMRVKNGVLREQLGVMKDIRGHLGQARAGPANNVVLAGPANNTDEN